MDTCLESDSFNIIVNKDDVKVNIKIPLGRKGMEAKIDIVGANGLGIFCTLTKSVVYRISYLAGNRKSDII